MIHSSPNFPGGSQTAVLIPSFFPMKHTGENVVRIEAEALRALADRIAGPMADAFERAVT